jgi:16S rRNA (cytosine1402-N4)-methyltransferase
MAVLSEGTDHVPVLLLETLAGLAPLPGTSCIDGTLGGAGHAFALLSATAPNGRLLGLDADPEALDRAKVRLARFGERAVLIQANFRDMTAVAELHGFAQVRTVLLDLGISWHQVAAAERGFSFQASGPLDMRMDPGSPLTAGEIVNEWTAEELADILYRYGEEPHSRRLAKAIVSARPLNTTAELAQVISRTMPRRPHQRVHPATRVFQALRIAVNNELAALEAVLPQLPGLLETGGRFAVITFHSLEDRIVKRFIQREARDCICPPSFPVCRCEHKASLRAITGRPVCPGEAEVSANPRSRSAKLRIAERL